jgi:hypothetical protein
MNELSEFYKHYQFDHPFVKQLVFITIWKLANVSPIQSHKLKPSNDPLKGGRHKKVNNFYVISNEKVLCSFKIRNYPQLPSNIMDVSPLLLLDTVAVQIPEDAFKYRHKIHGIPIEYLSTAKQLWSIGISLILNFVLKAHTFSELLEYNPQITPLSKKEPGISPSSLSKVDKDSNNKPNRDQTISPELIAICHINNVLGNNLYPGFEIDSEFELPENVYQIILDGCGQSKLNPIAVQRIMDLDRRSSSFLKTLLSWNPLKRSNTYEDVKMVLPDVLLFHPYFYEFIHRTLDGCEIPEKAYLIKFGTNAH